MEKQFYTGDIQDDSRSREEEYTSSTQEVEFRFVRRILQERHVYPEIGDVIGFDDAFFEIDNTQEVQLIAGRVGYNQSIICSTHLTRRSNIQIESRQV